MTAMHRLVDPPGEARDDYAIFSALAERLGVGDAFTEGRDVRAWLEHLYAPTRAALAKRGLPAPSFREFWAAGELALPCRPDDGGILGAFRDSHSRVAMSNRWTQCGLTGVPWPVCSWP